MEEVQSTFANTSFNYSSTFNKRSFRRWLVLLEINFDCSNLLFALEWENAVETPTRESLPTPQQMYKHGLEHLNLSIDYWQRALTIINLNLSNENQSDDALNLNRLKEIKQKIEFLLDKIDIVSTTNELRLILAQEEEQLQAHRATLVDTSNENNLAVSSRIHQEYQTALSVQSDLSTYNDRRSLRSIRSSDSFQSCPDVKSIFFRNSHSIVDFLFFVGC